MSLASSAIVSARAVKYHDLGSSFFYVPEHRFVQTKQVATARTSALVFVVGMCNNPRSKIVFLIRVYLRLYYNQYRVHVMYNSYCCCRCCT